MECLEDKSDRASTQQGDGIIVQCRKVDAIEQHTAGVGFIEAGQQIEQRRLADAGLAHDGQVLALPQFEIQALKNRRPIRRKAFA